MQAELEGAGLQRHGLGGYGIAPADLAVHDVQLGQVPAPGGCGGAGRGWSGRWFGGVTGHGGLCRAGCGATCAVGHQPLAEHQLAVGGALHGQIGAGEGDAAQVGAALAQVQAGIADVQGLQAGKFGFALQQAQLAELELGQGQGDVVGLACGGGGFPVELCLHAELSAQAGFELGLQVGGQQFQPQVLQLQCGLGFAGQHGALSAEAGGVGRGRCRGSTVTALADAGADVQGDGLAGVGGQGQVQLAGLQVQVGQGQLGWLLAGVAHQGIAPVHAALVQLELGHTQRPGGVGCRGRVVFGGVCGRCFAG